MERATERLATRFGNLAQVTIAICSTLRQYGQASTIFTRTRFAGDFVKTSWNGHGLAPDSMRRSSPQSKSIVASFTGLRRNRQAVMDKLTSIRGLGSCQSFILSTQLCTRALPQNHSTRRSVPPEGARSLAIVCESWKAVHGRAIREYATPHLLIAHPWHTKRRLQCVLFVRH